MLKDIMGNSPYAKLMMDDMSKNLKKCSSKKQILRRETCPDCGCGLVNLYYKKNAWKCKRCWDKIDNDIKFVLRKEE